MTAAIPSNMYAWRKHKGNPEPVSCWSPIIAAYGLEGSHFDCLLQVWEEVPVPETPRTGFLCKMLASGGKQLLAPQPNPVQLEGLPYWTFIQSVIATTVFSQTKANVHGFKTSIHWYVQLSATSIFFCCQNADMRAKGS